MKSILKDCTGVILAGGENKRMPVSKAFIKIGGETIIEKNLKIIKQMFSEVFIVTNQPELYSYLNTSPLGDVYDIRCPMTGIFTSLVNSSHRWVFISACDMPFINKELIKYMASKRDNYDAVLPKSSLPPFNKGRYDPSGSIRTEIPRGQRGDFAEPLFAFYSKHLMISMERALFTDKKGMKDFLMDKRVKYIRTEEIKKSDVKAMSFINLNTPEDIQFYLHTRIKG
ncbi:MAG: molybdenum cofactor guanylyltransferase [Nitrospirota bacterium]